MALYASAQERISAVSSIADMLGGAHIHYGVLSGGNWMVNCDSEPVCLTMRPAVGGKLTSGKGN